MLWKRPQKYLSVGFGNNNCHYSGGNKRIAPHLVALVDLVFFNVGEGGVNGKGYNQKDYDANPKVPWFMDFFGRD